MAQCPRRLWPLSYLVHASLRHCRLTSVRLPDLSHLRHLDLSHNNLTVLDMDAFLHLDELRTLILSDNKLHTLTGGRHSERQTSLIRLDLSRNALASLDTRPFKLFFSVKHVNLSSNRLQVIDETGFLYTQALAVLDLRGNDIHTYPSNVFKERINLQMIYADSYKLCCPEMLPAAFEKNFCFAPKDEISSCEDLLRTNSYRAFLWFISVASVMGNLLCFLLWTREKKSRYAQGFSIFVNNLSLADGCMGVYLAVIGGADLVYRGSYFRHDADWTSSAACSAAGFLSLLSSEVSALTICLITLDRFIALRFPFSQWRPGRRAARAACVTAWALGGVLAALPLLLPDWRFYSQSGICVPLPVTRRRFPGHGYSFGIIVVFNFILFLLVALGQVFIYLSVQANAMAGDQTTRKAQDSTIGRRLISVALSDFLCWFPIGLLGLMASGGFPVPGEANVALAIFVLPLNSALNPFLYTLNVLLEKRRKRREREILHWMVKNVGNTQDSCCCS